MSPLAFDNRFIRDLPGDPEPDNFRRQVNGASYSLVKPARVKKPQTIAYSKEVAASLGLTEAYCQSSEFAQVFSGNQTLPGMQTYASCYGGHQFGNWAGQLGDGRVINLGEVVHQGQHQTLQLKGSGPTPYSRGADGLAVLRSSVREFLCSEAMHHLGVPTTRALSLVLTGEEVTRDMFYDGNPMPEPGAIVCRVAPSFIRFGSFEILSAQKDYALLKQLADYTIITQFPELGEPSKAVYLSWFKQICESTALMIVDWMRVGFVHGVMNTDNMSISGLTIDYGPYGWLENYDPNWTPNTTDAQNRRYRFGHQAQIAHWNLYKLANAIYPLIEQVEPLEQILNDYSGYYDRHWNMMMAQKLGLVDYTQQTDKPLIEELLALLELIETDMTIFFRLLSNLNIADQNQADDALIAPLSASYYNDEQVTVSYKTKMARWLRHYLQRLEQDNLDHKTRALQMNSVNPKYVLRNYIAQQAIDKSQLGDHAMINELLEVLRKPYSEQTDKEIYAQKRPEWARHRAGCSMLSCSS